MLSCLNVVIFFLGNDRNCTILIRTPMIIKTGAEFSGKNFRLKPEQNFLGKFTIKNWSRIFWEKFSNKTGTEFSGKIYV